MKRESNSDKTESELRKDDESIEESLAESEETQVDEDAIQNLFSIQKFFKGTLMVSSLLLIILVILHFTLDQQLYL